MKKFFSFNSGVIHFRWTYRTLERFYNERIACIAHQITLSSRCRIIWMLKSFLTYRTIIMWHPPPPEDANMHVGFVSFENEKPPTMPILELQELVHKECQKLLSC